MITNALSSVAGRSRTKMVQVSTSDGVLEGEVIQDDLVTYNSFKGIPYAAPPVDDLRFKVSEYHNLTIGILR